MKKKLIIFISTTSIVCGCARMPLYPSIAVMPGPGKPFEVFVGEDDSCRYYARDRVGTSPRKAQEEDLATGTLAGAAIGATAGTAIGAISGDVGPGAVIGAGFGMLEGAAIGSNNGAIDSWTLQRQYDIAYQQCMYSKGNQVPGFPITYRDAAYPPPPPPPPSKLNK